MNHKSFIDYHAWKNLFSNFLLFYYMWKKSFKLTYGIINLKKNCFHKKFATLLVKFSGRMFYSKEISFEEIFYLKNDFNMKNKKTYPGVFFNQLKKFFIDLSLMVLYAEIVSAFFCFIRMYEQNIFCKLTLK